MAAHTSTTWQLHTQLEKKIAIQHPIQSEKMYVITKSRVLKVISTQNVSVNHVLVHDIFKNTSTALYVRLDLHHRKHVTSTWLKCQNTRAGSESGALRNQTAHNLCC